MIIYNLTRKEKENKILLYIRKDRPYAQEITKLII